MPKSIIEIVNEAKLLNAAVVSLPRILILVTLKDLGKDGATFRELKAALDINDGTLFANLKGLVKMGYIKMSMVKLENKKMQSFSITPEGKAMLDAACSWFCSLKE